MSPTPLAGACCMRLLGVPDVCASAGGAQAPAETPASPNPLRDWSCTQKPQCFSHPWPVHAAAGAKAWSPLPGTQLSPPRSVPAWDRAGSGEGARGIAGRSAHQRRQGGVGSLGTETSHPLSHPQGTSPELGCSPWSPGKPPLPRPCRAGSPQPSSAALQSGLGRPSLPWAGSRGRHAVSPERGRSRRLQHGGSCGNPAPLPLLSPGQVPLEMSPRHGRRHAS